MPFTDHSCRLEDPGKFEPGSFRTISRPDGTKIIVGRPKGSTKTRAQAIRYPTSSHTSAQAMAKCKMRKGKFEPAKTKESDNRLTTADVIKEMNAMEEYMYVEVSVSTNKMRMSLSFSNPEKDVLDMVKSLVKAHSEMLMHHEPEHSEATEAEVRAKAKAEEDKKPK